MANSTITITFNREALDGEFIFVRRRLIVDPLSFTIDGELFLDATRTSSGKIATVLASGTPGYVLGANTAYHFWYFFGLDYNGYGLYDMTWNNNVVTIQLTNPEWEFYDFTAPFATAIIVNPPVATFYLMPGQPIYSMATVEAQCDFIKASIQTSQLASVLYLNGVLINANNTSNPAIIEFPRGVPYYFTLENGGGELIHFPSLYGVPYPRGWYDFLSAGNISVGVLKGLTGATVTINVVNTTGLVLEYSLNNVNWQSENVFSGQNTGNYTIYVRDQFGCVKAVNYVVDEFGTREPFLFISEANSISFKERVTWNEATIFKNDENTLNFESDDDIKFCEEILFTLNDTTRIQIKSNFTTIIPMLRRENGTQVVLTLDKMSNNLNRFARMDAWVYKYNTAYAGIYFVTGSTYDKFGVPIEDYTLNGNLPDFAIVGQELTIIGIGSFQIKDVIYDADINKKVILVEYNFTGVATQKIVESVYDLLPYEVYEFSVVWNNYGVGIYDLVLENTDDQNGTVYHMSENINIASEHKDTVAIRYFNNNNRDVFYKYGIEHLIRVPLLQKKAVPKDETEINITDDGSSVIKSTVHEVDEFAFDAVSSTLMRKIVIALSCENLFVQGIGYVKDGSVSSECETNAYFLTVQLLKKGINYTNNRQGEAEEIFDNIGFNIPPFIIGDDGFIKT